MKIVRAMALSALFAAIILLIAQAQFGFPFYNLRIEIEPPHPTSNDEVLVHIGGQLPNTCYQASFFKLTRQQEDSDQITFSATVGVTKVSEICLQLLVPISNTYNLGKLVPGEYEFVLWGCLDEAEGCSSQSSKVLAHWRFSVGVEALPPSPCIILMADKTYVSPGDLITFTLKNDCRKTNTIELIISIQDGGNIVFYTSRQITLESKSSHEAFSFTFTRPGEYTITTTLIPGGTQSLQVLVFSNECLIPYILDLNRNNKIDDPEIINAIDIWVRGANIPGCDFPPQKLSDTVIVQLVDLWVRQQSLISPLSLPHQEPK